MTATILATLMALVFSAWIWLLKHQRHEHCEVLHAGMERGRPLVGHTSHQIDTHNRHVRHARASSDMYPIKELAPEAEAIVEEQPRQQDERYARVNGVATWTIAS